jgi:hydroxyethylthiazole kinase-like uncharacterized protein yjeF
VTRVLTRDEVRAVEERAAKAGGPSLMERAGRAAALAALRIAKDTGAPILVIAGPGNNGGDAWVAAAHLSESFHKVLVLDVAGSTPKATEAKAAKAGLEKRGDIVIRKWPEGVKPALIVDGLLGIGLARDVELEFAELIARINASGAPVLAIDTPSGLDSGSGIVRGSAVRATHTITFIAHKVGLHTGDGLDLRGELVLDDLGAAAEVEAAAKGALLSPKTLRGWLAPRPRNSHKGRFGSLGVIGGNRGMVGAALLAARAALLCGTGKVRAGLLASDAPGVDFERPELMLGAVDDALEMEVIVAGPGAGQSPSATSVSMFERTVMPTLIGATKPVVFDADALNAIAYNGNLETDLMTRRQGPTILTPHPAEAARLLHRGTPESTTIASAPRLRIAQRFNAHVVLKGAGSICAFPDGRWSINTTETRAGRGGQRRRARRDDRRVPRAEARARQGAAVRGLPAWRRRRRLRRARPGSPSASRPWTSPSKRRTLLNRWTSPAR